MRWLDRALLSALGLAAIFVVAAFALTAATRYPPEAPDAYATFRDGDVSFRQPPGWRASRRDDGAVEVRGPGGDVAILRGFARREPRARSSPGPRAGCSGGPFMGTTQYELDVPGAQRSSLLDQTRTRPGEPRLRVSAAFAETEDGDTVVLAVRTGIADDSRDARMIAGSLRLER